jgi:mono/diheme cytochrome c family protein
VRAPCYCAGLLGVVAISLTGCGARPPDSAQVRAVVGRYQAAIVTHDGTATCSLLTSEAQREVAKLAAALTNVARAHRCDAFADLFSRALARNHRAVVRISDARIGIPRVVGDRASVLVREPGESAREITLVKTHDGSRISLPPLGSTPSFDLRGRPPAIALEPPPPIARGGGEKLTRFNLGRTVVAQSGCLACHRIGEVGNAGPGPDLTNVGARCSSAAIERAIIHPVAPMPSFRKLPRAKLKALVTFLSLSRQHAAPTSTASGLEGTCRVGAAGAARGGTQMHRGGNATAAETIPTLSPSQVGRAVRVLRKSRALANLLRGDRYTVAHKGPWSTGGTRNRLIGAVFWLNLDHPTDIAGVWPVADYRPKRFPPYIERRRRCTQKGVETLIVSVDLIRGVVAEVMPQPVATGVRLC